MKNLESCASPKQWGDRQHLGGEMLEMPTGLRFLLERGATGTGTRS